MLGPDCNRDEKNESEMREGQRGRGKGSNKRKVWYMSWWDSSRIIWFVSVYIGLRYIEYKGEFMVRSGMCDDIGYL